MLKQILAAINNKPVTLNGTNHGILRFIRSTCDDVIYAVNYEEFYSYYVNTIIIVENKIFISATTIKN